MALTSIEPYLTTMTIKPTIALDLTIVVDIKLNRLAMNALARRTMLRKQLDVSTSSYSRNELLDATRRRLNLDLSSNYRVSSSKSLTTNATSRSTSFERDSRRDVDTLISYVSCASFNRDVADDVYEELQRSKGNFGIDSYITPALVPALTYIDPFDDDFYIIDVSGRQIKYSDINSKHNHYRGQRSRQWDELIYTYLRTVVYALDEGDLIEANTTIADRHLTDRIIYEYLTYMSNPRKADPNICHVMTHFDPNLMPRLRDANRCFTYSEEQYYYYVDDDDVLASILEVNRDAR